ncbi:similar to Saccharomyces cerevisiae YNL164C IBD2 Component of the BUB2-dependent spindle checkpoint pathway, interacts with Bfa1p and functions upstream of Bub2p and Bfa1p [Maudiozyma barnettii]|uniref:Protein IBD2 n=1 Tax=Maudiozyma barnettii TaxID=61262 RepID=A0A8H2VEZ0_9SACH|nr:Ibd2p [Kazachstania barnettii]CAB4253903.1 similar to Saccharomyces cerevisiae YNL164C IBD2 Component of the BUB2-dependent spindle checkpoint pathway, interacts with Bfa1p and functions upstream of Bub2p and Bfa1p [Kazachstania barnettii]CAD1781653.1 similar to Saccharomyces cerevisiae YNL164C IBD2 Component of the BUB2-dependent spindle checkpoint pathway, interacts with Bfa1p and functions upstream of Bub2p and Bfa1p [Kazachstania barnettii]
MAKGHSANIENGNTSIELVSKDGPIPINIMMQEGVKALTKILSNQLQDGKGFENGDHSMQFVIRNKTDKKTPQGTKNGKVEELEDEDIVEIDNHSNYHVHSNVTGHDLVLDENEVDKFLEEKFPDPELHINGEEAEIIFDYERQGLEDVPEGIGKKISEMIESVLPGSFSTDVHGRLHAVVNGNELNITEEGSSDIESHDILVDSNIDNGAVPTYRMTLDDERGEDPGERVDMLEGHMNGIHENNDSYYDHDHDHNHEDGYCPHHYRQHQHSLNDQQSPSAFRNQHYLDYDYGEVQRREMRNGVSEPPNFAMLLDAKQPMCMFCEYYMVFGEPPKNMIKWYNKAYGYRRMPMNGNANNEHHHHHNHMEDQQNSHRKRSR